MKFQYIIVLIFLVIFVSIYYSILHSDIRRIKTSIYLIVDKKYNRSNIRDIYKNYDNLPIYIKEFESSNVNYSNCENYWEESVKYGISRYKIKDNSKKNTIYYGPTIQSEQALNYVSRINMTSKNTLIKLRLKIEFDKSYNYYILPSIYCIKDQRIKLDKIKLRDINHTIRYINKAIEYINNNNNNTNVNLNEIKYLDLVIHYDDCPIIWDSIPFNIYRNDTIEYEKCILNSRLSKQIRSLFLNITSVHLENNTNITFMNENNIYNKDEFRYYGNIDSKNSIISNVISNKQTVGDICKSINSYINEIVDFINNKERFKYCDGIIQCYLPCYHDESSGVILSINKKLRKNNPMKLFSDLHCICKITDIPKGLIFSISSHYNSWDFGSIPYVNHLDSNEIVARTLLKDNNTSWYVKSDDLFFVGRYTDTFRLDLSCDLYNLLKNKFKNNVFISDSNKISCEKRAKFLQDEVNCDSDYICRNESISFDEWIELLIKSKISLDLSGVGPWSNRLRILLLFGTMIMQNSRSFYSNQFYDLLLKKNNLIFKFDNSIEVIENMKLILENHNISQKISKLLANFSKNCLSENGIILYFKTLLNELILWEISSNNTLTNSNSDEIKINPNENIYSLRKKIENCLH